tara:strand:- start:1296 stop:1934 length:639 start_codon:yes stop_codon:yes gene_type:complete
MNYKLFGFLILITIVVLLFLLNVKKENLKTTDSYIANAVPDHTLLYVTSDGELKTITNSKAKSLGAPVLSNLIKEDPYWDNYYKKSKVYTKSETYDKNKIFELYKQNKNNLDVLRSNVNALNNSYQDTTQKMANTFKYLMWIIGKKADGLSGSDKQKLRDANLQLFNCDAGDNTWSTGDNLGPIDVGEKDKCQIRKNFDPPPKVPWNYIIED